MDKEIIDKEDMYSVLMDFPNQVKKAWQLAENIKVDKDIDRIIITGMGGSALPGEILKSYLWHFKMPIEVNKNYFLPEYVNSRTLVFAISYSGNTEETIEAYRNAYRKNCKIIAITSGGKLAELAGKFKKDLVMVKSGLQPRLSYGYLFFPILKILQNSGIIEKQDREVEKLTAVLRKNIYKEKAKQLAERLFNKVPLIYSSERLYAIAYKWKINFNENSKIHAFCNFFPELNHNEMVGFTKKNGDYYCIIIKDDYDERRIKKRMSITKDIITINKSPALELNITGTSDLVKIFSTIHIGDWTSYILALKNKVDPTPVKLVEYLKKKL